MNEAERTRCEHEIRERLSCGDVDGATTVALRGYGPEIYAFLVACHRNEDDAAEVFSLFAEGLWQGVADFAWGASFRTWAFAIARRLSYRYRRDAHRRARRVVIPADSLPLSDIAAEVRSATVSYLQSDVRTGVAALRDALPVEDRELLVLRVDRQLAWNDLAQVLRGEDELPLEGDALKRHAAKLRKRFQALKERLREMAEQGGLLDPARREGGR